MTLKRCLLLPVVYTFYSGLANADPTSFPSELLPFSEIYQISGSDANGDRLIEGLLTEEGFEWLFFNMTPSPVNQQFSNQLIQLAPGQYFSNVYIPTAAEVGGDFSRVSLQVFDPLVGLPFPGNIIPRSLLGGVFAFLIGPPTPASEPLNFVTVAPCRVADTRNAAGPLGGPFIAGKSSRSLEIPLSSCNIPTTASAYSLNITVVPHGPLGYLSVWPTGQAQPIVSTLNSSDGRVKANAAITPAGTNGAVNFYASDDTDLVVDINGYFIPSYTDASYKSAGLAFYPLAPCRVSDTRNAVGVLGGPSSAADKSRNLPMLQSNCNLPSSALAYSLNFTAIPLNGTPLGYFICVADRTSSTLRLDIECADRSCNRELRYSARWNKR